jgi:hypothetical protein
LIINSESTTTGVFLRKLLIRRSVPFTAQIKLRSIVLKTGPGGLTPESCHIVSLHTRLVSHLHLADFTITPQYVNEPGLDFSSVEGRPAKEIVNLVPRRESVEYALRPSKFAAVSSIQLVFPNNISDGDEETTRVYYVGFKGEWNEVSILCRPFDWIGF